MSVMVEIDAARGVVRKVAEGPVDERRLAAEASTLRAAAHPGVVQILPAAAAGEPGVLELRMVRGPTIAERSPLDFPDMAWVGAALATTVADLHDIGIVHRAIDPEHVLIDQSNRPVLCGFGSARRANGTIDFARERRADVAALARTLIRCSRDLPGGRVSSALRAAAEERQRARWRGAAVDARALARTLAAAASSGSAQGAGSARARRCTRRRPVLLVALFALAATLALYASVQLKGARGVHSDAGATAIEAGAAARACPPGDGGCVPVPDPGGVVDGGYRILGASGAIVLGRWTCTAGSTPAILDRASGTVWVFDSWPAIGQQVTARLVGTVADASSLRVVPGRTRPCDRIAVERSGRRPALLDPRPS